MTSRQKCKICDRSYEVVLENFSAASAEVQRQAIESRQKLLDVCGKHLLFEGRDWKSVNPGENLPFCEECAVEVQEIRQLEATIENRVNNFTIKVLRFRKNMKSEMAIVGVNETVKNQSSPYLATDENNSRPRRIEESGAVAEETNNCVIPNQKRPPSEMTDSLSDIRKKLIKTGVNSSPDCPPSQAAAVPLISIRPENVVESSAPIVQESQNEKLKENSILATNSQTEKLNSAKSRQTSGKSNSVMKKAKSVSDYTQTPLITNEVLEQISVEIHLNQEKLEKLTRKEKFDESVQLARFIDQKLKTKTSKFNYANCLKNSGQLDVCVKALEELYKQEMEEKIEYLNRNVMKELLKLDKEVSRELVGGHLLVAYWKMDNKQKTKEILKKRKQFSIIYSEENLGILIRLVHSKLINSKYSLTKTTRYPIIELKFDVTTKKIELFNCCLSLNSFDRLSTEELTLHGVAFFQDGQEVISMHFNDFLDFTNMKRLSLDCYDTKTYINMMSIELSGDVFMEYLYLNDVKLRDWRNCKWNVKKLFLKNIPLEEKTKIEVQELTITIGDHNDDSGCDILCLPESVEKLSLNCERVLGNDDVELPNLKYLELKNNVHCLSYFHSDDSAPLLTHIHLCNIRCKVDVHLLPQTLTHLQITNHLGTYYDRIICGRVRKVDKLILELKSFERVEECLNHLRTDSLVVNNDEVEAKTLLQLMKKKIKTIFVGVIKWDKEDFQIYSNQLDREAKFYLLEGEKGKGVEEEEFSKLRKLF